MDWVSLPLALIVAAAAAQTPAPAPRAPQMPALPLTQLDDRALSADLDNRTFSLTFAQPVAVQDVLLLLVRGTSLSIVPEPSINGMFIGELKNVTVRQALGLILQPFGLDFTADGGLVRVFRRERDENGDRASAVEHYRAFLKYGSVTHGELVAPVRARIAALTG